jgi:shingomyelin synthase
MICPAGGLPQGRPPLECIRCFSHYSIVISQDCPPDLGIYRKDYTRIRVGSDDVTREGSFGDTRRTKDKENFPSEKRKTLVAGVWLLACMTLTALFITLTHDRFPPYATNHPLPDIILDNWDVQEWAFPASEKCIFALIVVWCAIVLFHRHKWIVLRRQFFIIGLWYLYRCVTMVVTNLPRTYEGWICSPKTTGYFVDVITMWIRVITSGGSSAGDLHTCGDYVFSGHTSAMVTLTLFIQEYSPRRFWPLHWACGITSLVGVVFILIGKGHYTLDCVVAYFVCTRLFWMYHTMAATSSSSNRRISLRHSDRSFQINRTMWYSMFHYFECNVKGLVPRQYGWPLPWPRNWAERDFDYEVVR